MSVAFVNHFYHSIPVIVFQNPPNYLDFSRLSSSIVMISVKTHFPEICLSACILRSTMSSFASRICFVSRRSAPMVPFVSCLQDLCPCGAMMPYHDIIVYGRKLAADQLLFLVLLTPSNNSASFAGAACLLSILICREKKRREKKNIQTHVDPSTQINLLLASLRSCAADQ